MLANPLTLVRISTPYSPWPLPCSFARPPPALRVTPRPIVLCTQASKDKDTIDVGANIFVGNLDPEVDEKLLYDTFSAFGVIVSTPKVMRDPDTGNSRGFGFVSFEAFEASDAAIEAMNGQVPFCLLPPLGQYKKTVILNARLVRTSLSMKSFVWIPRAIFGRLRTRAIGAGAYLEPQRGARVARYP